MKYSVIRNTAGQVFILMNSHVALEVMYSMEYAEDLTDEQISKISFLGPQFTEAEEMCWTHLRPINCKEEREMIDEDFYPIHVSIESGKEELDEVIEQVAQELLYPIIRKFGQELGSYEYYLRSEVWKCIERDAPIDTIYFDEDGTPNLLRNTQNKGLLERFTKAGLFPAE